MGEYARLNRLLDGYEESLALAREQNASPEEIAELEIAIGEIKGALLEMADIDGLDDPYMAFDYGYAEEPEENPYYDAYAEESYARMSEVGAVFYDEEQCNYADRNYNRLYDDEEEDYTPSATNGDYSPSNPWDAPGMSIRDFI